MSTQKIEYGTPVALSVTNLQSLANSQTVGWQSIKTENTTTKAVDYEVFVKLTTANTAPANDKCMYVYACPFYYNGSTWYPTSQGTATLPTGTEGASTIALPNNLRLLGILSYTTQNATVQDTFLLSNAFGQNMPDGFSIIIVNYSGANLSTGCIVNVTPITYTIS